MARSNGSRRIPAEPSGRPLEGTGNRPPREMTVARSTASRTEPGLQARPVPFRRFLLTMPRPSHIRRE